MKLALGKAVSEPVETYVDGFGSILFDGVVEDTICRAVVCSDSGRGLFVSQFNKGDAVWDCRTGIQVACTDFSFCSKSEDNLHDGDNGAEGDVDELSIFVATEEEAACLASGSAGNKVGSITMNVKDHVADMIEFNRARVTITIVEEISNVSSCFLGAITFRGGEFIDCMEHGVVQCASNV